MQRIEHSTSPSGEKDTDDIPMSNTVSGDLRSKLGCPGGRLASKTFTFSLLRFRRRKTILQVSRRLKT